jgi:hypothetical protein
VLQQKKNTEDNLCYNDEYHKSKSAQIFQQTQSLPNCADITKERKKNVVWLAVDFNDRGGIKFPP